MPTSRLLLCAVLAAAITDAAAQQPIQSAITYQGTLEQNAQPADGVFDFRVQLYDGPDPGTASSVSSALTFEDVSVTDGVFKVNPDFGPGAFDGEARWMQIGVREGDSTAGFTPLAPLTAITPAPQAHFALTAATANQATNADTIDGLSSGDFALADHLHSSLSAGNGIVGNDYTGDQARTFEVGAGEGIAVDATSVRARVDGASIGFNGSGQLMTLPHAPNYGDVATVAKSGGDYTDPVAAMSDRATWCSGPTACLLRIMPGLYDLSTALELDPSVHVLGIGNQLGQAVALRRNDTSFASGVIDASACGFNGCRVGNLTVATATTNSGQQSRAIHSDGGRLELWRVFVVAQSDYTAVYGLATDSNTTIVDSEFFVSGDLGYAISASNGQLKVSDTEITVSTSAFRATGIRSSGASVILNRTDIDASGATRATAVHLSNSFLTDHRSRLKAAGTDYSRAILASECSPLGVDLVGTELVSMAAATWTNGIYADQCSRLQASGIRAYAEGVNGRGVLLSETPATISRSRIEGGDDALAVLYQPGDTNVYPVRVTHSHLKAADSLAIEAGPYSDTAVALSRLENGSMSGTVSCVSNVDGDLNDLGNTCP